MDSQRAVKLLDETFNQEFDIKRFAIFINELFNHFKFKKNFKEDSVPLSTEYNDYIEKLQSLGVYRDSNKETIEVFAVKLKRDSSVEKARTMQRNSIANYLKKFNRNASLVAFYGDNHEDWRFSLVKVDYELFKDEKGNLKVDEKLTPAKRYSFLVGKNEPNHTCRSQFLPLIEKETEDPTVEEIENAFSVEKVTKEFFNEYKELFLRLKDSLDKIIGKDPVIKAEFDEKNIITADFAKKLMGQIVFIYFLQKKGWLGVEMNQEWGTGPKNFLRTLYDKKDYDNFFNDILEHLFYDALATDRYDDYYEKFECKIPFLNGGLFEPINLYNWRKTGIKIDNKIFGDILDTFDLFNFTIKEDEPLERIVAVDPEMLGKVFENLLEVKDRKSKGAFYTPREIVHYMCQQSLINYLGTHLEIPKEDIESFIQLGDFALDSIIRAKELGQSSKMYALPESIIAEKDIIDKLIDEVKIVDPAVGSGAFLVGMMNEMLKVKSILSLLKDEINVNYDIKHQIIENSLYGVDLDSSAVDITKLRFWLSLIVDEESIDDIKPLPNLDHKVMCGNSLLEEYNGLKLFDENILLEKPKEKKELKQITLYDERLQESRKKLKRLRELQKLYFNEQNKKQKDSYREEIDKIEWELIEETLKEEGNEEAIQKLEQYKKTNSKPFFLWKLYFAEVFQRENPGFDVVIANPPYIDIKNLDPEFVKCLFKNYDTSENRINVYSLFIEKSLMLLNQNGHLGFIIPNSILFNSSYKKIRKLLLDKTNITTIVRLPNEVFESAKVETIILMFKKTVENKDSTRIVLYEKDFKIKQVLSDSHYNLVSQELWDDEDFIYRIFSDDLSLRLLKKIERNTTKLMDICDFSLGLTPYDKYKGHSADQIKEKCYHSSYKKDHTFKKLLKGSDITRYGLSWNENTYISYGSWLGAPREPKFFTEPRILIRQIVSGNPPRIFATFTSDEYYNSQIGFNILMKNGNSEDLKFVLAVLNSKLMTWYHREKFLDKSKTLFQKILIANAKKFPIKITESQNRLEIISNVNEMLALVKNLRTETTNFKKWIFNNENFNIKKSKKLNSYYNLSLESFLNELKKQKIDLKYQEDIINRFNGNLSTITPLLNKINSLDNEIDYLIYNVYELNENEIEVIENFHSS